MLRKMSSTPEPRPAPGLIGASGAVRRLREQIAELAAVDASVRISGEPGSGKTFVAHAIYDASPRVGCPFLSINCATLPVEQVEADLLRGGMAVPVNGVLLLDDADGLNPDVQSAVLRVLTASPLNVRVLMTSTADSHHVGATATIVVPALRDRRGDIPLLVDHFLEVLGRRHRRSVPRLCQETLDVLLGYSWPGNVGELEHALERTLLACDRSVVQPAHLPVTLRTHAAMTAVATAPLSLEAAVDALEARLIRWALEIVRGNRSRAARWLDTSERVLNYKMKKLGIDHMQYRA